MNVLAGDSVLERCKCVSNAEAKQGCLRCGGNGWVEVPVLFIETNPGLRLGYWYEEYINSNPVGADGFHKDVWGREAFRSAANFDEVATKVRNVSARMQKEKALKQLQILGINWEEREK